MVVQDGPLYERRSAENQAVFRELNERIDARVGRWPEIEGTLQRVVCECSLADCVELLGMTTAEYGEAHRTEAHFSVAPHHEDLEFERVVERHARYWVVEKFEPPSLEGTLPTLR